jgi:16S rRNA (guanine527-N7)-methyltransferase
LNFVAQTLEIQLSGILKALDLPASAQQRQQLLDYLALLGKWNSTYNLTAVREVDAMMTLHLADCLAVVQPIATRLGTLQGKRLLDVGTGGGLPGIVLAIMLPQLQVTLNDTVQKKCAFLQQAKGSLALPNVNVIHSRVETISSPPFDIICSRAFSDLPLLLQLTSALVSASTHYCAMKAIVPVDEIAKLPKHLQATVEPLQVPGLDAERCLIWIHTRE